eukprot:394532-Pleurochrysis_carterae.AAC.1
MRMPMTERHISSSSPPEAFAAVCEAFSTCRNQFHMFYYLRRCCFCAVASPHWQIPALLLLTSARVCTSHPHAGSMAFTAHLVGYQQRPPV